MTLLIILLVSMIVKFTKSSSENELLQQKHLPSSIIMVLKIYCECCIVKALRWVNKTHTYSQSHTYRKTDSQALFIRLLLLYHLSFSPWNNCLSLSPSGQNTVSMSDSRERWGMTARNDVLLPLTCKTEATFALQSLF